MNGPLKSLWSALDTKRASLLNRARDCSALTIPHLLPPLGYSENQELPTPYQSIGARGVNNLASKLLLTLLPPNTPSFRLMVDSKTLLELEQSPDQKTEIEKRLVSIERETSRDIDMSNVRTALNEALRLFVCTGNVLTYQDTHGGLKVWALDKYVVQRDGSGNLLTVVIQESVSPAILTEDVRVACGIDAAVDEKSEDVEVYTGVFLRGDRYESYQEINSIRVPGSEASHPKDAPAYIALRSSAVAGEDYGRGLVEEYLGDLRSLEGLSKSIVVAAAASAKVLFLRSPTATTRLRDITNSESGDVVNGNADDISVLQVDKYPDMRVAMEVAQGIENRLAQAFLMNTAVQRNAERVTAEEIRYVAQELEDALGGIYSILSREFQLPFIRRRLSLLSKSKKIPTLPKDIVSPAITTGIEALGRGHDIARIRAFLEDIVILGPEVVATYLSYGELIQRAANARGIDSEGLVKTETQVQQERQSAMMQNMTEGATPGLIQEAAKAAFTQRGGNNGTS